MWKPQQSSLSLNNNPPLFNLYSDRGLTSGLTSERRAQASDCTGARTYTSSRWCPAPEQLRALEEFYKRGIRTPSTYQIQQIAAQLRRFGKIEGKNVFYWFQNHKARERQKIRRRLSMGSVMLNSANNHQDHHDVIRSFEGKSSKGIERSRNGVQVVHNKNWPSSLIQEGVSISRANTEEGERDGWIRLLMYNTQIKEINNPIEPTKIGFEPRRSNKILELFPIHGNNDCVEKTNEDPVQFYEFL